MTDSIGQQLRQRREARHISLEQAAQATRIRLRYLQALEADNIDALPSTAHVRGFLRTYAQLLELPAQVLLAQLDGTVEPQTAATREELLPISVPAGAQPAASGDSGLTSPQAIFVEIGGRLRRQREMLGLSLEDVEQNTHLRLRYLNALENGRLSELPSPVQGRGMLSNYASFLGLDIEPLLLRYADGLQAQLSARRASARNSASPSQPEAKNALRTPGLLQRVFSGDLLVGIFLVVFLAGFVTWAALRVSQMQSGQLPTSTAPSIAEVLALSTEMPLTAVGTPTPSLEAATGPNQGLATSTPGLPEAVTVEAATPTLGSTPTFPVLESGKIQLYLVARQRAWVRISVDGKIEFEGRVVPGSAYLFNGSEWIELLTGNGAALQVFLNRQDLGILGIFGEVVQRIFTLDGMLTPTPAISPTSPALPSDTPTATVSGTVQPTGTPTPADTPRP